MHMTKSLDCFQNTLTLWVTLSDLSQPLKKLQQIFLFLGVLLEQIFILQIKIKSDCSYQGKSHK